MARQRTARLDGSTCQPSANSLYDSANKQRGLVARCSASLQQSGKTPHPALRAPSPRLPRGEGDELSFAKLSRASGLTNSEERRSGKFRGC